MMTSANSLTPISSVGFATSPNYNSNSVMLSYQSYVRTSSVYFKTILNNENFNHIKGGISKNAFDKIQEFSQDDEISIDSDLIFKYDNFFIFGYYDKYNKNTI